MLDTNETLLPCVEINPTTTPVGSVIWLHGLGADGNDFVSFVPELKLPDTLPLRFIFPHAPLIPVTINNGYVMRAWYDILAINVDRHADEAGIHHSVAHIEQLIAREVERGIPHEKIIVAGFSQGAVIALTTGLTYSNRLAGIIALSGYLPHAEAVFHNASPVNKSIPIFLAHGTSDAVVPHFLGESVHTMLQKQGYSVDWHSYNNMPHSVCSKEIEDIAKWMMRVFKH